VFCKGRGAVDIELSYHCGWSEQHAWLKDQNRRRLSAGCPAW